MGDVFGVRHCTHIFVSTEEIVSPDDPAM